MKISNSYRSAEEAGSCGRICLIAPLGHTLVL